MLPEISLHVLDIAQNSVRAQAKQIVIKIVRKGIQLELEILDDGCGMSKEQLQQVTNPFFTTRTTRKIGLGVPFLKQAAECTGGAFYIQSELGRGTHIRAVFHADHIDCIPLGNMDDTILSLIQMNPAIDFVYHYQSGERMFELDTREMKKILGDVSLQSKEVVQFMREYLEENREEIEQRD